MSSFILSTIVLSLAFLPLSLGVFLSLKIYTVPDITTDGSFVLGGCVSAILIDSGLTPMLALPIAIIFGFFSGVATGAIHTKLKVNALLSGIIVMTALFSINLSILGKPNLTLDTNAGLFGDPSTINLSLEKIFVLAFIVLFVFLFFSLLLKTDYGLSMRATGSNETMAETFGIHTDKNKIIGLGFANGLSAMSGFLFVQIQGFADINMGIGIVIAGLASVMIADKITPSTNKFSISSELIFLIIGTFIYRFLISISLYSGIPSSLMKLLTAVLVLGVLMIPVKKKNR